MGRAWNGVLDIRPHPTKAFVTEDGRKFQDCEVTITQEWAAELHAGYRCARCLEGLHELGAFPEHCPLCGFEVGKHQRHLLEQQYKGVDTSFVPALDLDREWAAMERQLFHPKGLVTPSLPKPKPNKERP